MKSRDGWERGQDGPMQLNGKSYKHLVEFKRTCASCGVPFSIFVTKKIAAGHADSNSFGLRNCGQHRRNKPGSETGDVFAQVERERNEAWEMNTQLMATVGELTRRLGQYELPAALRTVGCETVQNTANGVSTKMPWEA